MVPCLPQGSLTRCMYVPQQYHWQNPQQDVVKIALYLRMYHNKNAQHHTSESLGAKFLFGKTNRNVVKIEESFSNQAFLVGSHEAIFGKIYLFGIFHLAIKLIKTPYNQKQCIFETFKQVSSQNSRYRYYFPHNLLHANDFVWFFVKCINYQKSKKLCNASVLGP